MALIAIAVSIGFALDSSGDDPQVQANKDNIAFLTDFKKAQLIVNNDLINIAGNNTADIIAVNKTGVANKATNVDQTRQIAVLEGIQTSPKNKDVPVTGCRTGDMNLLTSSANPNDIKDDFLRGSIVYITGKTTESGNTRMDVLSIATSEIIEDSSFFAGSDGSWTKVWITDENEIIGKYRLLFDTLGGPKDCVEITIK